MPHFHEIARLLEELYQQLDDANALVSAELVQKLDQEVRALFKERSPEELAPHRELLRELLQTLQTMHQHAGKRHKELKEELLKLKRSHHFKKQYEQKK
ncbi:hypothetical protein [Dongshaea marina]|uniref:hypothetical protein n=1 Tax=Dongshaea marina TaxID=2047966 RepID=UPI000D3E7918|nr:hypothetical protein [Dongshaea marina]